MVRVIMQFLGAFSLDDAKITDGLRQNNKWEHVVEQSTPDGICLSGFYCPADRFNHLKIVILLIISIQSMTEESFSISELNRRVKDAIRDHLRKHIGCGLRRAMSKSERSLLP